MKDSHAFIVSIVAILVAGIVIIANGAFYGNAPAQRNLITVSATGSVTGYPSLATIYITVNATANTTAEAVQKVSLALQSVNQTLLQYTNKSSINTDSFSVSKIIIDKKTNETGYYATETLHANLNNISQSGQLIGDISTIEGAYITGFNSKLNDVQISSMRSAALIMAMSNATQQAQAVAGNAKLETQDIAISSYAVQPLFESAAVMRSGASPIIFTGTQNLVERISVTFSYK